MDPIQIIEKYYANQAECKNILITHSRLVAQKAANIIAKHPELPVRSQFVYEAAMLHDLGIFKTNAPGIACYGEYPYICHGYLGADLLRSLGYEQHALVAERHTGTGLKSDYIIEKGWPLPQDRCYEPQSLEEQLVCFADKFYSKTHLTTEKSVEAVRASLAKWSDASVERFDQWCTLFL